MRTVVITAVSAISGNGNSIGQIYKNMLAGEAARISISQHPDIWPFSYDEEGTPGPARHDAPYTRRDKDRIDTVCGVPLANEGLFDLACLKDHSPKDRADNYDRHQLLAHVAAGNLLRGVGGVEAICEPTRFGIVGGTGNGGLTETYPATLLIEKGKRLGLRSNLRELPNTFVGMIARTWGIKGPGDVGVTACAASSNGFINAVRMIKLGEADAALVVGAEAVINPFGAASFTVQSALANESKPYQKDRKGFLMGEGGAAVLIESLENAQRRGARVLAEVAGYGSTTDGNPDGALTDPDPSGGARSAMLALEMASIGPENVSYINTHGTGTPVGDKAELEGIRSWAGEWADRILISSTKSFSGHLLGAAGAFELALCIAMMSRYVLPTHGLTRENIDPELASFNHVMAPMTLAGGLHILSNSFGFGGANASILLRRRS
jgi:3-oxoacyl-[acyl-carrier-protein] synthase II